MRITEQFLDKAKAAGYGELEPNDWSQGVRVGSEDEKVWFDVVGVRGGLGVELIHGKNGRWEGLLDLLVDFANEQGLRLEIKDWSKRNDLPVDFPGSQFTQSLKRNGFRYHPWKPYLIREPFPN